MGKIAKTQTQHSGLIIYAIIEKNKFTGVNGEEYGFVTGLFNIFAECKLSPFFF